VISLQITRHDGRDAIGHLLGNYLGETRRRTGDDARIDVQRTLGLATCTVLVHMPPDRASRYGVWYTLSTLPLNVLLEDPVMIGEPSVSKRLSDARENITPSSFTSH
jgi:hypothetical protein